MVCLTNRNDAAIGRLSRRSKRIPQKEMIPPTFDAHQRSPNRVLGRKPLARDQARTLTGAVAASHLRRERQKQFIQAVLSEKVAHQARPALHQDDLALPNRAYRLQDEAGADRASWLYGFDPHRALECVLDYALCPFGCGHDQNWNLAGLEYAQVDKPTALPVVRINRSQQRPPLSGLLQMYSAERDGCLHV